MKRLISHFVLAASLILQFASFSSSAVAQSAPTANDIAGYSGLLKAAHMGDADSLLELIKDGNDLEIRDGSGRTPLIVAAFASHDEIVESLAKAGADMNALESRAYDIVTIAAVADDVPLLKLAIAHGASAKNITSPYDGTALIAAAHLGHYEVVDILIKAGAPLDHVNNLTWTALMESVVLGNGGPDHIKVARLLIEAGADQSIGDAQGVTAIEHAKSRGYSDMIQLFDN